MTCPLPHRNPAEPDPGYIICRRHLTRLTEHLTAIAVILDDLDELLITPPPMDANDARSARCDPPAPCRLDVLDLTDKRSDTPALHLVSSWCLLVSEERRLSGIPSWPSSQARWLTKHVDWIGHHPAADDRNLNPILFFTATDSQRKGYPQCRVILHSWTWQSAMAVIVLRFYRQL